MKYFIFVASFTVQTKNIWGGWEGGGCISFISFVVPTKIFFLLWNFSRWFSKYLFFFFQDNVYRCHEILNVRMQVIHGISGFSSPTNQIEWGELRNTDEYFTRPSKMHDRQKQPKRRRPPSSLSRQHSYYINAVCIFGGWNLSYANSVQ